MKFCFEPIFNAIWAFALTAKTLKVASCFSLYIRFSRWPLSTKEEDHFSKHKSISRIA